MKFCSVCDKPLDFIEFLDGDVCSSCREKSKRSTPPPGDAPVNLDPLLDCEIICGEKKIEVRSPEGWILWSGETERGYRLATILASAQRILAIRRKRKN